MIKVILLLFLIQNTALGKIKLSPLLKCLAKEEAHLAHVKSTGPNYKLNQFFINEVSSYSYLELKSQHYQKICHHNIFSPSVSFLKTYLENGKSIFLIPRGKRNQVRIRQTVAALEELENQMPHIFISYLASLQQLTATAHCLTGQMPELVEVQGRIKYLESEVDLKKLIRNDPLVKKIWEQLPNFKRMAKRCAKSLKRRMRHSRTPKKRKAR